MINEERKKVLREIWLKTNHSQWHKLVGDQISLPEWQFLCSKWNEKRNKDQQTRPKPLKSSPTASTNKPDDMQRLINDLC